MVRHEAVGDNLYVELRCMLPQKQEICILIAGREEHLLPVIAAMRDVVGKPGKYDSSAPRHGPYVNSFGDQPGRA
jgi:hypothetical protein